MAGREFTAKRITVPTELYTKAMKAIKEGQLPGLRNFSEVCEKALFELLKSFG